MPTKAPALKFRHGLWVLLSLVACDSYDETLLVLNATAGARPPSPTEPYDAGSRAERDAADNSARSGDASDGDGTATSDAQADDAINGDASAGVSGTGGTTGASGATATQGGSGGAYVARGGSGGAPAVAGSGGSSAVAGSGSDDDAGLPSGGAGGAGSDSSACAVLGGQLWVNNGHCYFPLDQALSWNVSRDRCAEQGATLVSIASADEQAFASGLVGTSSRWMGLAKFGSSEFSWVTGEALRYVHWEAGAPTLGTEAAALLRDTTHEWFDEPVTAQHAAICELP